MKRVAVFVLVGSALALASWSVSTDVVPSVEAPLFGMWNRLNANVEHEVMHFWVEGSTWAGCYDKHPEPGLGFPTQTGSVEAAYAKLIDAIRDPARTASRMTPAVPLEVSAAKAPVVRPKVRS